MKGWLVVSNFLNTAKYNEINEMILDAFKKRNIELEIKTNTEVLIDIYEKKTALDFVIFWDKDILLAKHMENMGLRLFNRAEAIEACDDKGLTAICIERKGIKMPRTIIAPLAYEEGSKLPDYYIDEVINRLKLPIVIKESFGSFGQQVYLVKTKEELIAKTNDIFPKKMIFQEYISSSFGRDIRIQVIGGKVVVAVKRFGKEGDFRANVTNGGKMLPHVPTKAEAELAIKAATALNLDFAGVDILYGEDGEPILCEVNSNAHFKNLFDATGINIAYNLADYVMEKLK